MLALPPVLLRVMAVLPMLLLCSCSTWHFYSQAVHGQYEILHRARTLQDVGSDPSTPEKLRGELKLVENLRAFALKNLDLTVQKQFGTYTDLRRPYVVWNVYAAPEFSTEAITWWYPFVGAAKYRGYFSVEEAKAKAQELKKEGDDVFVGGIRVYSTLGWFRDPVLNTFIETEEADLAETIFHELAHARLFIGGDTDFNEAFATAVGQEGVRRWFRSQGRVKELRIYERSLVQEQRILHLLQAARSRLEVLYAEKGKMPVEEMRRRKQEILDHLRADYLGMKKAGLTGNERDYWFDGRLNNARLATVATYHDLVPAFAKLLKKDGGDFQKFYAGVAAMKPLTVEQRRARLQEQ